MADKNNIGDVVPILQKLTNNHSLAEKDFWFENIVKHANDGYYGLEDAEVFYWLNNIDYRCVELIKIYLRLNKCKYSVAVDLIMVCYVREKEIRQAIIELMASGEFTQFEQFIRDFDRLIKELNTDITYDKSLLKHSKRHRNMINLFGSNYTIDDFYHGFDSSIKLNILI